MKTLFVTQHDYIDPAFAFQAFATDRYALLFDSSDHNHPDARFSYILINPAQIIETKNHVTHVYSGNQIISTHNNSDPFEIARTQLNDFHFSDTHCNELPPFQGGIAGLFCYDLFSHIENIRSLHPDNSKTPDMAVGLYNHVIAFDNVQQKCWQIIHDTDKRSANKKRVEIVANTQKEDNNLHAINWSSNFTKKQYKRRVKDVKDYIIEGDIFQANLSQKFAAKLPDNFNKYEHYLKLRQINSAPFAAFFNQGHVQISSASPELFLNCDEQGNVTTKPIKGTMARDPDPSKDLDIRSLLHNSEKDRAENIMITDLLRNDLSKCCNIESINVPKLCAVESFEHIHHLVSTVTGKLGAQYDALDLLRSCLPGGSITGAPKIRAIEIIDELETDRRHAYCGSLAMIGHNGTISSNILIRTLIFEGDEVSFNVGGGITLLSNAETEYEETLHKARKIFESFSNECSINVGIE